MPLGCFRVHSGCRHAGSALLRRTTEREADLGFARRGDGMGEQCWVEAFKTIRYAIGCWRRTWRLAVLLGCGTMCVLALSAAGAF